MRIAYFFPLADISVELQQQRHSFSDAGWREQSIDFVDQCVVVPMLPAVVVEEILAEDCQVAAGKG
jgi:hypothetical protein